MDFIPDLIPLVVVKAWAALSFLFAFGAMLRQFGGAGRESGAENEDKSREDAEAFTT